MAMNAATIILVLSLPGILIGLILGRRHVVRKHRKSSAAIAFLCLILGSFLIFYETNQIDEVRAHAGWPTVPAVILSSTVEGDEYFRPLVSFQYRFEDSVYVSTTYVYTPGYGGKWRRYEVAEKIADEYRTGDTAQVHVNPDRPSEAILKAGTFEKPYLRIGFGSFLYIGGIALGVGLLFSPGRRSPQNRSRSASSA